MIVGLYVLIKKKSLVLNIDSETITLKINYFVRHSSGKNPPPNVTVSFRGPSILC